MSKEIGTQETNEGMPYYGVIVPKTVSKSGYIHLRADAFCVGGNGDLNFIRNDCNILALAEGSWLSVFAADIFGGGQCAADHWEIPEIAQEYKK